MHDLSVILIRNARAASQEARDAYESGDLKRVICILEAHDEEVSRVERRLGWGMAARVDAAVAAGEYAD